MGLFLEIMLESIWITVLSIFMKLTYMLIIGIKKSLTFLNNNNLLGIAKIKMLGILLF